MAAGSADEASELAKKQGAETVAEFCRLIDQSRQLFKGLRELPQFGHKSWRTQFGKTFDIYTKLWKFQQENSLRTSESNYLKEAFSFYTAIRTRAYYTNATKFETADLMVKKLRYYARFIVVTLLLNKMDFVKELAKELRTYVDEYATVYQSADEGEWRLVINEVTKFIECDSLITILNEDLAPRILSHRLDTEPKTCENESCSLSLQEIVIVGNSEKQVKFSELTLDMFRMLQALEREPEDYQPNTFENSVDLSENQQIQKETTISKRPNPHKYLLYKPTFSQLFTFLASGFKELPRNAVMLIYLSADGDSMQSVSDGAYGQGGVKMSTHKPSNTTNLKRPTNVVEHNAIFCEDLMPFTRKPLMVIVDSTNSASFKSLSSCFGQPVVSLMSPKQIPNTLQDSTHKGSLFTLFLYNPLVAFLYICNVSNCQNDVWNTCLQQLKEFENELKKMFESLSKMIDIAYIQFSGDEFLALMIHRFIFCYYITRQHKAFKGEDYYPLSSPLLPAQVLENKELRKRVLSMTSTVEARSLFYELEDMPSVGI